MSEEDGEEKRPSKRTRAEAGAVESLPDNLQLMLQLLIEEEDKKERDKNSWHFLAGYCLGAQVQVDVMTTTLFKKFIHESYEKSCQYDKNAASEAADPKYHRFFKKL